MKLVFQTTQKDNLVAQELELINPHYRRKLTRHFARASFNAEEKNVDLHGIRNESETK